MLINKILLDKYNVPTPRYTSYPPANFFSEDFTYAQSLEALDISNKEQPENISFYIHIPFCSQLCYYCGCNTHITNDKKSMQHYVDTIKKEILLYKNHLSSHRKISQIHWGGGTPDYLSSEQIADIMAVFFENFNFIDGAEIAMECHPAHLDFEYIDKLIALRFNRISIGVQDFNKDVLKAVNRATPLIPINKLVKYLQKQNISVNLDFVYGLPLQRLDEFTKTIQKAVEIAPDRIALFSYAHVPWVKPHQKILERYDLPDASLKTEMFEAAYTIFQENNYISIGLDHFAKPTDELSIALSNKVLSRNFQGYCTKTTTGQVYALGVSGISQLSNSFLQNTKNITTYTQNIDKGEFAFEKAYFLNREEKIISYILTEIMSNRYLSFKEVSQRYDISYEEIIKITKVDLGKLQQFEDEGLLQLSKEEIKINHQGLFFLRNIASTFDPLMQKTDKQFSKAL